MKKTPSLCKETDALALCAEQLYQALIHFKHEGKVCRRRNTLILKKKIETISKLVKRHKDLHEKVIFSFFQRSGAGGLSSTGLLRAEHEDLIHAVHRLKVCMRKSSPGDATADYGIYEAGVYLVALLRYHLEFEKRMCAGMKREMVVEDQSTLMRQIDVWLKKSLAKKVRSVKTFGVCCLRPGY